MLQNNTIQYKEKQKLIRKSIEDIHAKKIQYKLIEYSAIQYNTRKTQYITISSKITERNTK